MIEPPEPHDEIVLPNRSHTLASIEIFVPVERRFTLTYYGDDESLEYSITMEALQSGVPWIPLRMTMGNADSTGLMDRCMEVIRSGFIKAKGELVIDHGEQCVHLLDVRWFEAAGPPVEMTGAVCYPG